MAEIDRAPVSQRTLVEQLRGLGLPAAPVVVVHAAFEAVGPVEGGPEGLIAALRASRGLPTLWTNSFFVPALSSESLSKTAR